MEKLIEHVYGTHAYMKLKINDGTITEIDVYWAEAGTTYKVPDSMENRREEIIHAFNELF